MLDNMTGGQKLALYLAILVFLALVSCFICSIGAGVLSPETFGTALANPPVV